MSHAYNHSLMCHARAYRFLLHPSRHGPTSRFKLREARPVFSFLNHHHDITRQYATTTATTPTNPLERLEIHPGTTPFDRCAHRSNSTSSDAWTTSRVSDAGQDEVTGDSTDGEEVVIVDSGRQGTESAGFDRLLLSSSEFRAVSGEGSEGRGQSG